MVAVVAGSGTGLEKASAWILGSRGLLGQSGLGRSGENVFVNAANGNLVVQNRDEMLVGLGPDAAVSRTYNSLGDLSDDNGDNWRLSVSRRVTALTGTVNTAGSTVRRVDWDGSESVYAWNGSAYVTTDGDGAHDTLTYSSSAQTWTWTDGSSRQVDVYSAANGGRIVSSRDKDGNALTFAYNSDGLVSRVTTQDGGYIDLVYAGLNLVEMTTGYRETATGPILTLTRVRYAYDAANRLASVTVDLTPEDGSVADGQVYVTTYGYDGASRRVTSIGQSDGSSLQIAYQLVGGDYRVASLTQAVATGVSRVTSFDYSVAGQTTITDPSGLTTMMRYDAAGRLTEVLAPGPNPGGAALSTRFAYDADGNVIEVIDPSGARVTYTYDARGNRLTETDALGNLTTRTYSAANQVLTETRTGTGLPAAGLTTRYAYDGENHLRYVMSAEGVVTQYSYTASGLLAATYDYINQTYPVGGLAANAAPSEGTLIAWVASIDKSGGLRTSNTYDFRGNLVASQNFSSILSNGGTGDALHSTTTHAYDQFGRLLKRNIRGFTASETFLYDGLGRLIGTTDFNGGVTTVAFDDAAGTTLVTTADGAVTISVYDRAGELVSVSAGASTPGSGPVTTYAYDAEGRLRMVTDPTGVRSHVLYDRAGRKAAEIDGLGRLTEYGYDADGRLVSTVRYANALTAAQRALLTTPAGAPAAVGLASVRPAAQAGDAWNWTVYDVLGRVIQVIGATGATTTQTWDAASRLMSSTSRAVLFTAAELASFRSSPPLGPVGMDQAGDPNRITRYFYDKDGHQIGRLDGEGYLIQVLHDGAGRPTQTIRYATATNPAGRATGDFATLLAGVGATAADIREWTLYDSRGFVLATIDGEGGLTRYAYAASGNLGSEVRGQKLDPAAYLNTPPTLAGLPAAGAGEVLDLITYARDAYGRVLSETRTLASGTEKTTYTYDKMGRVRTVGTVTASAGTRGFSRLYDALGRVVGELSGEGYRALLSLGSNPTQAAIDNIYATRGTAFFYDDAGRMTARVDPDGVGGAGRRTAYYYDASGAMRHEINALGEVISYGYDGLGRQTTVVVHAARIGAGTLAALNGGLTTPEATAAIAAVTDPARDSRTTAGYNADGTLAVSVDAMGAASLYSYNAFGELTLRQDPKEPADGPFTRFVYDRRGLLVQTTRDFGGLNQTTAQVYDAFGRVVQETDPLGRTRGADYDRAGRVLVRRDALGGATTYAYDGRGNTLSVTDRTGRTTSYAYTAFNRAITVTTPEGVTTTTTHDNLGLTLTLVDGDGRTTTWTYDADGRLKTEKNGLNQTATWTYDQAGQLYESVDASGMRVRYSYDAAGRVLTETRAQNALNLTTTYAYDAKGQVVRVTDASGLRTDYEFDRAGRQTKVVVDPDTYALTTLYTYDRAGNVTNVREASGTSAQCDIAYTYDRLGRLTAQQTGPAALNIRTTYAYDASGNVTRRLDALDASNTVATLFAYDAENRPVWQVDGAGSATRTQYDAEGRVTAVTGYVRALSAGQLSALGAAPSSAQIAAAVTADARDRSEVYVYDDDGRLVFSRDAGGRLTETVYDGAGHVVRRQRFATPHVGAATSKADLRAWTAQQATAEDRIERYAYDAAGRQVYGIDAAGRLTASHYDAAGRRIRVVQFAAAYSGDATKAALDAWVSANANGADRKTHWAYNAAGLLAFEVDAADYVTQTTYSADYVRSTVRFATAVSVNDGVSAATLTSLTASQTASAATTTYGYDQARRVNEIIDPMGVITRLELDGLGRVVNEWAARGTADESQTNRVYDAGGRMLSETRGAGAAEASTRTWTYDGLGRVLTEAGATGEATTYAYDAMGRVVVKTRKLTASTNAVTTSVYDAFGNLAKVTDPRGAEGFFYYDKLDRLTLQIDPERYATQTTYGLGGEVATVTRRAARIGATPAVGAPPAVVTGAGDATTRFTRDKLDRLIGTTDAEGYSETYGLNAFGDRVSVTNRLGGTTTYTYDKRGLALTETLPVGSETNVSAGNIVNTFVYDSRGNLLKTVEAANFAEARTTSYAYNKLDRLIQKVGDVVSVLAANLSSTGMDTPVETLKYDLRGNVIETNVFGARTLFYYDDLDRKIGEIDASGALRRWTYDAAGNVQSQRVYDTTVALPANAGGNPPSATAPTTYRETLYAYDLNNRQISATVAGVRIGQQGSTYTTSVADLTTRTQYDAAGNVVRQIDARGGSQYAYYDKLGRQIARVDAEGYATFLALNAEGNVLVEDRFNAKPAGVAVGADPAVLRSGLSAALLRTTTFTYDRNGRRLTESRAGVGAYVVGATGGVTGGAAVTSTIAYTYNGLGQVLSRTSANGDRTDNAYDAAGRLTDVRGATFVDYLGDTLRNRVTNSYNGLGDIVSVTEGKDGSTSLLKTTFVYGAGGRLSSTTDASGFTRSYAYDTAGRVVRDSYVRVRSDGTSVTEAISYRYDALGRAVYQATATLNGSTWSVGDRDELRYNTHGEVTAKGVNGGWQESFSYDKVGRLWRTTAGDGVARYYVRDANGNATLTLVSAGTDISGDTLDQAIARVTTGGVVASAAVAGVAMTVEIFDARNRSTQTRELFRQLSASTTVAAPTRSRVYNAFGEITQETDARGAITTYTYNTMGRLVRRQDPTVNYTTETGAVLSARPTEDYYYDIAGRLVGTRDANGNLNRRLLLAGTGHDGEEGVALKLFNADGGVVSQAYDVFGNLKVVTDAIGGVEQRVYDQMGRLTSVQHVARAANSLGNPTASAVRLVDYYAYDGLGQRTQHWNNQFGTSYKERTDYDAKGRVVLTTDFEGRATTTAYLWDANLTTTGLGTFGGWVATTANTAAKTSVERTDVFGRTVGRTDLGGRVYMMGFDKAGRLVAQTSSAGQSLTYSWYNTGLMAQQSDVSGVDLGYSYARTQADYEYDVAGNRTRERYVTTEVTYAYAPTSQWNPYEDYYYEEPTPVVTTTVRQNATVVYDALNRMIEFRDVSVSASDPTLVTYTYDLNSNVRSVTADYRWVNQTATGTPVTTWNKYDAMNRFTTVDGRLENGQIVRGYGVDIEYDLAGNRRRRISSITVQTDIMTSGHWEWTPSRPNQPRPVEGPEPWDGESPWPLGWTWYGEYETRPGRLVEYYDYTADGYLARVSQTRDQWNSASQSVQTGALVVYAEDLRDQMGRLTSHKEYAGGDASRTHERTAVYDRSSLLLSETNFTFTDASGTDTDYYTTATTTYDYRAETSAGSGVYTGQFLGVVTRARTTGAKDPAPVGGAVTTNPTTQMTYAYVWWDDARQAQLKFDTNTATTSDAIQTSTFAYDVNGRLTYVNIQDGRPRNVTYVTDANGQVLTRTEVDNRPTIADPKDVYYYFNGARVGEVTNNGEVMQTYVDAVRWRTQPPRTTPTAFHYGDAPINRADFDLGYEGLTPGSVRGTASAWTVRDGDTLQSIATAAWGDASLWYLIAEANGLNSTSQLVAGQSLSIPAKVANVHNTSDTFRPYDPNKAMGDVSPTQPKPVANPGKKGCGVVGQIIAVVIAVVVAAYVGPALLSAMAGQAGATAGAQAALAASANGATAAAAQAAGWAATVASVSTPAAFAAGALTGAAASMASQAFLIATGAQDTLNWKGVGLSALSAGVSLGVGQYAAVVGRGMGALPGPGWVADSVRGAGMNVLTQGVSVAVGLQDRFDWTAVAAAGATSSMGIAVAARAGAAGLSALQSTALTGAAAGVTGAGVRSLLDGTSFGDNLNAVLPDVIGQTIGNAIVGAMQARAAPKAQSELAQQLRESFDLGVGRGFETGGALGAIDSLANILKQRDIGPQLLASLGGNAVTAADLGAMLDLLKTEWVSTRFSGVSYTPYVARDIQVQRLSDTEATVSWINHLDRTVTQTFGVSDGQYLHITDRGPVRDLLNGESIGQDFYLYDEAAIMGPATELAEITVVGERTAMSYVHQGLNYTAAVSMGVLNGFIVQPVLGLAEGAGHAGGTIWDAGAATFGGGQQRAAALQSLARRGDAVADTLKGAALFTLRYNTDFDGSFRRGLTTRAFDAVSRRWGAEGPMGVFNAASDITGVASTFIPGANAGRAGQAGRLIDGLDGVSDVARAATYARGSAERAFLLEQIRSVRGSGANRLAEQRGIVFGHREASRLGYEPILTSLHYKGTQGLDGLFVNAETGRFAIWEFKGGVSQTGLSSLKTYRGQTQGSQGYIASRIGRYSQSSRADASLAGQLRTAISQLEVDSFVSFSGSKRTYQLPMNGNSSRPGVPR